MRSKVKEAVARGYRSFGIGIYTPGRTNRISSNGDIFIVGENLTWNNAAADEGCFIVYNGQETKCVPVVKEQDASCAAVNAGVEFAASGEPIGLVFRTRLGGKTLHRVEFNGAIVTM